MNIKEIKQEIENNFDKLPEEVQEYINYLEDKNIAYRRIIIDIKTKLFNKQYKQADSDLAYIIFNGINVQGYED